MLTMTLTIEEKGDRVLVMRDVAGRGTEVEQKACLELIRMLRLATEEIDQKEVT